MKKLLTILAAIIIAVSSFGQNYQNVFAKSLRFRPVLPFLVYPGDSSILMIDRNTGLIYRTHVVGGGGGGTTYTNGYALDLVGNIFSVNKPWRDSVLAAARSRSTHTGTQLAATISDFTTAVQGIGDPRYILNQTTLQTANYKISGSGFAKTLAINYDDFSTAPVSTSTAHTLWIGATNNLFGSLREAVLQSGNQAGFYINPTGNFVSIGQQTPLQKRLTINPGANQAILDGLPLVINFTGGGIGLDLGKSSFRWGSTTNLPASVIGNSYYDSTTNKFRGYRSDGWKNFLMEGDITGGGGGNSFYDVDDTISGNRVVYGENRSLSLGATSSRLAQFLIHSNTTIDLNGMVKAGISNASDGNYTIPETAGTVYLPIITANRTVTLPSSGSGKRFNLFNQNNTSFSWNVSGNLKNPSGVTITNLDNRTWYELENNGSDWFIKSINSDDTTIINSPIEIISGTKDTLRIRQSSSTDSGYLSKEDWNTFNGKANNTLNNLGTTSINQSLVPASDNSIALGSGTSGYTNLWMASGGAISFGAGNMLIGHSTGTIPNITISNGSLITRITPRISTTPTNVTITPDINLTDIYTITALATNTTMNAPSGTAQEGQSLIIRIKDNGTSRTLTWNAVYRAGTDFALPTATTAGKEMYIQFIYNNGASKWDAVGLSQGY